MGGVIRGGLLHLVRVYVPSSDAYVMGSVKAWLFGYLHFRYLLFLYLYTHRISNKGINDELQLIILTGIKNINFLKKKMWTYIIHLFNYTTLRTQKNKIIIANHIASTLHPSTCLRIQPICERVAPISARTNPELRPGNGQVIAAYPTRLIATVSELILDEVRPPYSEFASPNVRGGHRWKILRRRPNLHASLKSIYYVMDITLNFTSFTVCFTTRKISTTRKHRDKSIGEDFFIQFQFNSLRGIVNI